MFGISQKAVQQAHRPKPKPSPNARMLARTRELLDSGYHHLEAVMIIAREEGLDPHDVYAVIVHEH